MSKEIIAMKRYIVDLSELEEDIPKQDMYKLILHKYCFHRKEVVFSNTTWTTT
jgi:hypothetical protein